jgi:hypothetical protein
MGDVSYQTVIGKNHPTGPGQIKFGRKQRTEIEHEKENLRRPLLQRRLVKCDSYGIKKYLRDEKLID